MLDVFPPALAELVVPPDRDAAASLDAADELAPLRQRFLLPEGVIYLDGNSLGPLPASTPPRLAEVVNEEWGRGLVRSWTAHGWIDLPLAVGDAIAELIGAAPGEVVVTDSVSVNLFKLLLAALRLRPGRPVILTDDANFPTDLYVAQGVVELLPGQVELRAVPRGQLEAALDRQVAVLSLSHVDFRTGELLDLPGLTQAAHRVGALALWDISHSAGVVPLDLDAAEVDLAVGCGYKYLNGGPGAPSFAYVARRLQEALANPISGWMGHAAPFDLDARYRPAAGVARLLAGTPPILSLVALAEGVRSLAGVGVARLRRKSRALTDLFIALVEREVAAWGFQLASPRQAQHRGAQVSFHHPHAYPIVQALIARGVIGDFRAPDLLRFGFAPAYLGFVDVWDAVARLRQVMAEEAWRAAEYHERKKVT